jgi:hypothetical protein
MCISLREKFLLFSTDFRKILNVKFNEIPSCVRQGVPCKRTDRTTDMTKLRVVFRNFANAPEHCTVRNFANAPEHCTVRNAQRHDNIALLKHFTFRVKYFLLIRVSIRFHYKSFEAEKTPVNDSFHSVN